VSRWPSLVVPGSLLIAACAGHGSLVDGTTVVPTVVVPNATVDDVIDGDTIDVHVGDREERVRMIGIDTPEIAHPSMGGRPANPAECFGERTSTAPATGSSSTTRSFGTATHNRSRSPPTTVSPT
jgi:endonuclease YncB( thermonuclease family)